MIIFFCITCHQKNSGILREKLFPCGEVLECLAVEQSYLSTFHLDELLLAHPGEDA